MGSEMCIRDSPKLWQASGVPYAALIDELVQLALERHRHRRRNTKR